MAELVAKNVKLYIGGKNLSRNLSQSELTISADLVDNTKFGSSGRSRLSGLKDVRLSGSGFFEAGASSGSVYYSDPILQNLVASTGRVYSMLPAGTGLGSVAYFTQAMNADYQPAGAIGDMFGFAFSAEGAGEVTHRGAIMEIGSLATSDTQTVRNTGVSSSSKTISLCVHALTFSSSQATVTVNLLSDDSSGFAAPTTTISMSIASSDYEGVGAGIIQTTGTNQSSSDGWYRIELIGATTVDTMTGLVSMAISPGTTP